jgi:hypothetical protein
MQVEHLAHGNSVASMKSGWNDASVYTADSRYAKMLNGDRIGQVPCYESPNEFERQLGFCSKLNPAINQWAAGIQKVSWSDPWWLLRCPAELLENRDNLVHRHIAINWQNEGLWYLAFVRKVQGRAFIVKFLSNDEESHVRLAHFGYDLPPKGNGQDWRLVDKNSRLTNQEGRGITSIRFSSDLIAIFSLDESNTITRLCTENETEATIEDRYLFESEPQSQPEALKRSKMDARLEEAETKVNLPTQEINQESELSRKVRAQFELCFPCRLISNPIFLGRWGECPGDR